MIDLKDAANSNETLVLTLIRAMETGELSAAIDEECTDDFVWENSGLDTIKGRAALFEQMARGGFASQIPILKTMTHFSAELIHIASKRDVVFTERVDHHWDEEGRDLMTPHICGIAEIRGGKISAFRDYYDVVCYQQEPTEIQEGFDFEAFRDLQTKGFK